MLARSDFYPKRCLEYFTGRWLTERTGLTAVRILGQTSAEPNLEWLAPVRDYVTHLSFPLEQTSRFHASWLRADE
jgi:hypothetical protein